MHFDKKEQVRVCLACGRPVEMDSRDGTYHFEQRSSETKHVKRGINRYIIMETTSKWVCIMDEKGSVSDRSQKARVILNLDLANHPDHTIVD